MDDVFWKAIVPSHCENFVSFSIYCLARNWIGNHSIFFLIDTTWILNFEFYTIDCISQPIKMTVFAMFGSHFYFSWHQLFAQKPPNFRFVIKQ